LRQDYKIIQTKNAQPKLCNKTQAKLSPNNSTLSASPNVKIKACIFNKEAR